VYLNPDYTGLLTPNEKGFYEVFPGQTLYLQIKNIESFFEKIQVRVSYEDIAGEATERGEYWVLDPDGERFVGGQDPDNPSNFQTIVWTVPSDAVPCNTYVVQYRNALDRSSIYIASSPFISRTAHLHVTPEIPLGTIGAISALFGGFVVFRLLKGRKTIMVPAKFP